MFLKGRHFETRKRSPIQRDHAGGSLPRLAGCATVAVLQGKSLMNPLPHPHVHELKHTRNGYTRWGRGGGGHPRWANPLELPTAPWQTPAVSDCSHTMSQDATGRLSGSCDQSIDGYYAPVVTFCWGLECRALSTCGSGLEKASPPTPRLRWQTIRNGVRKARAHCCGTEEYLCRTKGVRARVCLAGTRRVQTP